jgi:glutamine amidotransferase
MITIVDYGLGNVRAFLNVFKRLNLDARAARTAEELEGATRVILPGVGTFDHAMRRLVQSGMREPLEELVLRRGVPLLGVCVGMQMLARTSEEGREPGLGWIAGEVVGFRSRAASAGLPLPHMGWNDVRASSGSRLFDGLESSGRFYFLHSYFFQCDRAEDTLAVTTYGMEFSCAVCARNIYGVQFHPEKSHRAGTQLLQNFARL